MMAHDDADDGAAAFAPFEAAFFAALERRLLAAQELLWPSPPTSHHAAVARAARLTGLVDRTRAFTRALRGGGTCSLLQAPPSARQPQRHSAPAKQEQAPSKSRKAADAAGPSAVAAVASNVVVEPLRGLAAGEAAAKHVAMLRYARAHPLAVGAGCDAVSVLAAPTEAVPSRPWRHAAAPRANFDLLALARSEARRDGGGGGGGGSPGRRVRVLHVCGVADSALPELVPSGAGVADAAGPARSVGPIHVACATLVAVSVAARLQQRDDDDDDDDDDGDGDEVALLAESVNVSLTLS
jgi:hypothetical protein